MCDNPVMRFFLILSLLAASVSGATLALNCTSTSLAALTPGSQTSAGTLTCPQFNPALGTLVSYTIRTEGIPGPYAAVSGSVTVENLASSALVGGSFPGPTVGITYTGLPGQSDFSGSRSFSLNGPVSIPVGGSQTFTTIDPGGSLIVMILSNRTESLGSYVGNGTFQAAISTSITSPLTLPGLVRYSDFSIVPAGGIGIIYQYDEVPEPTTLTLVAGSIGLLAAFRRKR